MISYTPPDDAVSDLRPTFELQSERWSEVRESDSSLSPELHRLAFISGTTLPLKPRNGTQDWFELQLFFNQHPEIENPLRLVAAIAQRFFNSPEEPTIELFDDGDGAECLRLRVRTPMDVNTLMTALSEFDGSTWCQLPARFRSVVMLHFDEVA